ncbi:MFS transporter [Nocardia pseudobrasiliensis]|uniref:Putative MFS family arabinose efflux permease n=1 Tax=Nocardia pseudobrasiliensis TaxID=45979 RepID=A0A370I9A2_9NOCA|nr:MFS transporter [Nocardia pseudobrasiliensis]RDI67297.1 putative MFS family arabinose efflux permease [Nocardia pseudobrasiliensis]
MTAPSTVAVSTWAPLTSRVFRALWIAQLVSNLGTWMQTVGAQWLLVDEPGAATWVSLVQTATTLPVMLLSIPSGVLADLLDRRRLLIGAQAAMAVCAALLTAVTASGRITPLLLLTLLFLLGIGQAMTAPAWQAIQPELVPRNEIPAAAALGSMSQNVGRAVGPAIAGVLVSLVGPTLVFAVNAVSFLGVVGVLILWRRPSDDQDLPAERPIAALQAGLRFIRASPAVRRVLLRSILFIGPASALWALLPVIAHGRLGLSSSGYGLLLGALGVGAVVGATQLGRLRRALSPTRLLALAAVLFGVATLAAAAVPIAAIVLVALVFGGFSWLVALSTMNSIMQLLLPGWVRARGLSVYQLVFMGGQAVGSLVWGVVAGAYGTTAALWCAAILLGGCAVSTLWLPVRVSSLDTTHAAYWPEPILEIEPDPEDGPVLVLVTYYVPEESAADFSEAMARVGRSRQRTGAMEWRLYRDVGVADRYIEAFVVRSWEEHMRQHQVRLTAQDQLVEDRIEKYTTGESNTLHLVAVQPVQQVRTWRRG